MGSAVSAGLAVKSHQSLLFSQEAQMIESIQAGFQAIKGGLDIAQGFQSFKTEAAVNQAVIDIQRSLLEAQRGLNEAEARHTADLQRIS